MNAPFSRDEVGNIRVTGERFLPESQTFEPLAGLLVAIGQRPDGQTVTVRDDMGQEWTVPARRFRRAGRGDAE